MGLDLRCYRQGFSHTAPVSLGQVFSHAPSELPTSLRHASSAKGCY